MELLLRNPELILAALVIIITGAVVLSRKTNQADKKSLIELLINVVLRKPSQDKPEDKKE